MTIRELQLLSEALWEAVKTDLDFFSPIQLFVKRLSEFDYSTLNVENRKDILLYANKIEAFFNNYRRTEGSGLYFPPAQTSRNDDTVKTILSLATELSNLSEEKLIEINETFKPKKQPVSRGDGYVFLGHGRSKLWARVQLYLKDDLKINTVSFESDSHTNETIINILEDFLNKATYAILILSAEDETSDGKTRARQNVIHEAGLFQGRLGFNRVTLLKQDKTEDFSNVAGLQFIPFTGDNIEQTFYELQRILKKAGLLR